MCSMEPGAGRTRLDACCEKVVGVVLDSRRIFVSNIVGEVSEKEEMPRAEKEVLRGRREEVCEEGSVCRWHLWWCWWHS